MSESETSLNDRLGEDLTPCSAPGVGACLTERGLKSGESLGRKDEMLLIELPRERPWSVLDSGAGSSAGCGALIWRLGSDFLIGVLNGRKKHAYCLTQSKNSWKWKNQEIGVRNLYKILLKIYKNNLFPSWSESHSFAFPSKKKLCILWRFESFREDLPLVEVLKKPNLIVINFNKIPFAPRPS